MFTLADPDVEATDYPSAPDPEPVVDLGLVPGARLALQVQCAAMAPELLSRTDVLDAVEAAGTLMRWLAGVQVRMLADFADRHPADSLSAPPGADESGVIPSQRWVPDEVGMTLGVSRLEAMNDIARAQRFAHVLPDTLDLLERGRIDLRRAEAIARATAVLPDDKARAVEASVLPKAPDATLRQVRDRVRRAIARVDPDGEYRRHTKANVERRVSIRSLEDGMASLWFYGAASEIEAAWQMADRLARSMPADDERTLDQRRFDLAMQVLQGRLTVTEMSDVDAVVTDILSGHGYEATPAEPTDDRADGGQSEIPPDVLADAVAEALSRRPDVHAIVRKPLIHVVVGLDTLLGDDRPAELVGHGPIDSTSARALAASGVLARLVTDPLSGKLLDVGRTTYAPPAALDDHVRARDQVCRGPQCGRRIRDLDHHQDWALGGETNEHNLFGVCLHHHKLKDADGWQVVAQADRSLTWISPCGRRYTTEPFDHRPFTDDLSVTDDRPSSVPPVDVAATVIDADDAPPF